MAEPTISEMCLKVFGGIGAGGTGSWYWETVAATTTTGSTTVTLTRTGRTAGSMVLPPAAGLTVAPFQIQEATLGKFANAWWEYFYSTAYG